MTRHRLVRRRLLLLVAAAATLVIAAAVPAAAVGTDGVEMTPELPQTREGLMPLTVEGEAAEGIVHLLNSADEARTVTLFAVRAERTDDGGVSTGLPGSAPWFGFAEREVELAAGERRELTFTTRPDLAPELEESGHIALVMEVVRDETLVLQAARLVGVDHAAPSVGHRSLWVLLALLLLVATAEAVRREGSRRRRERRAPPVTSLGAGSAGRASVAPLSA